MIKPTFDLAGSRTINRLGFGAMRIPDGLDEAREVLERALELEVNPYDESVGALKELQDEGKIRHIGVSNVTRDHLSRARSIVDVVSVQNNYRVGRRDSEDVLDVCEQQGIAFIPWFPIASGDLAKPGGALDRIAEQNEATSAQVAIAWLLHRSPVMIPIPGTSSVSHLEENIAARDLELTDDNLKLIEDAVG